LAELVGIAQPIVRCGEASGVGRGSEIAEYTGRLHALRACKLLGLEMIEDFDVLLKTLAHVRSRDCTVQHAVAKQTSDSDLRHRPRLQHLR